MRQILPTDAIPTHDWPDFPPGLVWLVGAGPGDPGLLTLHALNALRQADVIVHDALVEPRILEWRAPGAVLEFAGKRGGKPSPKQRSISLRLIELSRQGKRVLRLKGGDPFVFGRGGEEAQTLVQAGVPIRVTPGVTAGTGGLAYAGIPVTHRDVNQVVTFVTGHDQNGRVPSSIDWEAISQGSPVIVLYMAMKHFGRIAERMIAAGRDPAEPVAVVSNATLANQRVVETVLGRAAADVEAAGLTPPAIICIGRVALLRQALDWQAQAAGEPVRDADPLGLLGAMAHAAG
ncbi:MAG: uroporphyrinogen-III C-methyltransferase [Pseudomonadota bacterium]